MNTAKYTINFLSQQFLFKWIAITLLEIFKISKFQTACDFRFCVKNIQCKMVISTSDIYQFSSSWYWSLCCYCWLLVRFSASFSRFKHLGNPQCENQGHDPTKIIKYHTFWLSINHFLHQVIFWCQKGPFATDIIQSNLYKTATLGTIQKWSSWTGGRLIKHLSKRTRNQIWPF